MDRDQRLPRCQVIPLPDYQVSLQVDGQERLRWHYGPLYPRPFFYPLTGPSGASLIRMGHPGAPDHDHHRGIWFAHNGVVGNDFWSDTTAARIRQLQWYCYEDGEEEGRLAVQLGWFDGHDPRALVEQQVMVALRPQGDRETTVEIQSLFQPVAAQLEFGQSNFGFVGVRVAKGISAHFGAGTLTDSEQRQGESAIFQQRATWVDYSGQTGSGATAAREGLTYFDHPDNPSYPTLWHVRDDGWMIASACQQNPLLTSREKPLLLRYLLHAHAGPVDTQAARQIADEFARRGAMELVKSSQPHLAYEIRRR